VAGEVSTDAQMAHTKEQLLPNYLF
jgi:hypothetical protein